ncbi:hypothetical protein H2204_013213 [Knufia peltigerae]|uniref:Peroxidase n=1 Tax=Knufia peltigerae TaxID=1002370 RepID=A0AA38XQW7_9EURO|nr:hypothetical protein H2204_013213 [Knufia peltigerae]
MDFGNPTSAMRAGPLSGTDPALAPVHRAIRDLLYRPGHDDGCLGPLLVRLAWHCAGTYCVVSDTGGSNGGAMRFDDEANDPSNAGLETARSALDDLRHQHQLSWLSHADLYTLAGVVAIETLGGPKVKWLGGRTDYSDAREASASGSTVGRLPDASKDASHVRQVFHRMGFEDRDIVALCGAHCLGRCHADRSGFEGKWVRNPTRFSNAFFRTLKAHEWHRRSLGNGLYQFSNIAAGASQSGRGSVEELMMLPADMALLEDPAFRVWVDKYAKDKDLFFKDFADAFAKLLELGLKRDQDGRLLRASGPKASLVDCPMQARL